MTEEDLKQEAMKTLSEAMNGREHRSVAIDAAREVLWILRDEPEADTLTNAFAFDLREREEAEGHDAPREAIRLDMQSEEATPGPYAQEATLGHTPQAAAPSEGEG